MAEQNVSLTEHRRRPSVDWTGAVTGDRMDATPASPGTGHEEIPADVYLQR